MPGPFDNKPVKLVRKKLDEAGLDAHLATLASAEGVEIRTKGAAGAYSDAATEQLDAVVQRLRAGEIVAIQIYFFQDGDWWFDTLMRGDDCYRLVRMKQELPPDP